MTTPRQRARSLLLSLAFCGASLGGCSERSDFSESLVYQSADEQKRFTDALTAEGIPYKIRPREDGRNAVHTSPEHRARVEAIRQALFGAAPPMGRSIGLNPADMQRFEEALRNQGISYERTTYHGQIYISWSRDSDAVVLKELERVAPMPAKHLKDFRAQVRYQ